MGHFRKQVGISLVLQVLPARKVQNILASLQKYYSRQLSAAPSRAVYALIAKKGISFVLLFLTIFPRKQTLVSTVTGTTIWKRMEGSVTFQNPPQLLLGHSECTGRLEILWRRMCGRGPMIPFSTSSPPTSVKSVLLSLLDSSNLCWGSGS